MTTYASVIPRGVWVLGFVSMLMDISSEMVHALLPIYLVTILGASALAVGFIEGVAEATAQIVKIFSGGLSDWLGRRKFLTAMGYGMAALTKPVFPLASSLGWIVAARFIDRIGKGIRGAPRDAMIADMTTPDIRGAAFGLRQSLDTIGAVIGPLIAMALMALTLNNFRVVFWVAVVPAVLAAALVIFAVREPERATASTGQDRMRFADLVSGMGQLPALYWLGLAIASVLTLARFSEAFLILKAQQTGVALALLPAVLVVMNVVYAGLAFPVGRLSDRLGRIGILAAGTGMLVLADLVLALADGPLMLGFGVVLWGVHMALTQSLLAALVADTVPAPLRGTGFGLLNFATGIALFAASVVAGALWTAYGAQATFLAGAAIAALGLVGLMLLPRPQRPRAALP